MSDIVERLKYELENDAPLPGNLFVESHECVAEITRLRADRAALVEAMEKILIMSDLEMADGDGAREIAATAVAQTKAGEP